MNSNPKLTFCTGVGTVTGANFLLEIPLKDGRSEAGSETGSETGSGVGSGAGSEGEARFLRVLVDCGLIQGERIALQENEEPFSYSPGSIQALFVTHAHLDHVGRIPKLVKEGFKGPIYSTLQTRALAELVLNDAGGILKTEAGQEGFAPLYDESDVQQVFPLWKTVEYHEPMQVTEGVEVIFKDAGHILGSSMIEFSCGGGNSAGTSEGRTKILFTGDLGNSPAPLLRNTEEVGDVDFLVMESVYGDRNHDREGRANQFRQIINDTIERGGTLVIPTFSIDRTQVLLYELNNFVEKKLIPSVPVFVDSPMAIKATEIYKNNTGLFNDHVREQIANGDDIFKFPHLQYTFTQNESRVIENTHGPKIVLAGSGMSIGGRVIGHEKFFLPDEKNTILLVGYQTAGSLGRHLLDGAKKVHIHGEAVKVKAHIETIYGYSAHKDSDHLVQFVSTGTEKLKQVFVAMGEPKASMHLAQRINDELGVKAIVPDRGRVFDLN
jgi:metallo-beta-lactamase family protein